MIKSDCILKGDKILDGERISIMSRHTLNDGTTPDVRITKDKFDKHIPKLGPTSKLIGKYLKNEISFGEYKEMYIQYLDTIQNDIIETLVKPSLSHNVTVLCIEENPDFCHRKILVEYTKTIAKILLNMDISIQID